MCTGVTYSPVVQRNQAVYASSLNLITILVAFTALKKGGYYNPLLTLAT